MTAVPEATPRVSLVPARMDRLPWTKFHWSVVIGLGVSWVLDGLGGTIVAAAGFQRTLSLTPSQVSHLMSVYLVGQVVGALYFGWLTDRVGRKKMFTMTLVIYLAATGVAGLTFNLWFLYLCLFVAGMGIGGEYAAVNAAIDELIPARYRGRADIYVNGTYWAGAALAASANVFLLNTDLVPADWGWRIGFFIGPLLGLSIIYLRRHIPESPRWLLTHGRQDEAERTVDRIEASIEATGVRLDDVPADKAVSVVPPTPLSPRVVLRTFLFHYPRRTFLAFTMLVTQAFLYNAIFFSSGQVLENFYHLSKSEVAYCFFPFAIGNLLGPLLLARFFDTIGRRKMIFGTYAFAGVTLALSAALFNASALSATTHTVLWCVSFFFASAGASSAYLTVSEIFPLELRGQAISYFFAIGQGTGGALAPSLFGALIGDATSRGPLAIGYYFGAGVMIFGGVVAWFFGVDAEQKSLEDITDPLATVAAPIRPAVPSAG